MKRIFNGVYYNIPSHHALQIRKVLAIRRCNILPRIYSSPSVNARYPLNHVLSVQNPHHQWKSYTTTMAYEKNQIPTDELEELKAFLMQPVTSGPKMQRTKDLIEKMMQFHVFPTMSGQDAALMSLVANALEDNSLVVNVYTCLMKYNAPITPITMEITAQACTKDDTRLEQDKEQELWQIAMKIVQQMHKDVVDIMDPSLDIYENAILSCHRAGKWAQTIELLEEAKVYHLQPSLTSYLYGIKTCILNKEPLASIKAYETTLAAFPDMEIEEQLDIVKKLLQVAINIPAIEIALYLHDKLWYIDPKNPDLQVTRIDKETTQRLLNLCAIEGKWYEGRLIMHHYLGESKSLAPTKARSNRFTFDVRKLMRSMEDQKFDISLDVYNAAFRAFGVDPKRMKYCTYFLKKMKYRGIACDATTYAALIRCSGGDPATASKYFRQLMNDKNILLTNDACHAMMYVLSKAGEWKQLLLFYEEIMLECIARNQQDVVDTMNIDSRIQSILAVSYARTKQHKNAISVFTHMKMHGLQPSKYVYGDILFSYIGIGKPKHALILFEHLSTDTEAFPRNTFYTFSMVWDAAILAASKSFDKTRAHVLYDEILRHNVWISPHSAVSMVELLSNIVPLDDLWNTFKNIKNLHWTRKKPYKSTPSVLNSFLLHANKANSIQLARAICHEATTDLQIQWNAMTYSIMMELEAGKTGDSYKFLDYCNKMAKDTLVTPTTWTLAAALRYLQTQADRDRESNIREFDKKHDVAYVREEVISAYNNLFDKHNVTSKKIVNVQLTPAQLGSQIMTAMQMAGVPTNSRCWEIYLSLCKGDEDIAKLVDALEQNHIDFYSSPDLQFVQMLFFSFGEFKDRNRLRRIVQHVLEIDLTMKTKSTSGKKVGDIGLAALSGYCASSDGEDCVQLLSMLIQHSIANGTQREFLSDARLALFLEYSASVSNSESNGIQSSVLSFFVPKAPSSFERIARQILQHKDSFTLGAGCATFCLSRIITILKENEENPIESVGKTQEDIKLLTELLRRAYQNIGIQTMFPLVENFVPVEDRIYIDPILFKL